MKTSESIKELAAALCNVQANIAPAKFNAVNPFFKSRYADLNSVYEACRGLMTENGLALVQFPSIPPIEIGPAIALTSRLMHESGEWLEDTMVMPLAKTTAQDYGSGLTYARRYALSAIIGIVSDEDDDGNQSEPITDGQKKALHAAGNAVYGDAWDDKRPELVEAITKKRTRSSNGLSSAEASKLIEGINAKADKVAGGE